METEATALSRKQQELAGKRCWVWPLKPVLQAFLLVVCILIIVYFYYGYRDDTHLHDWGSFSSHLDDIEEELIISENSKLQPTVGFLLCFVSVGKNYDKDRVYAIHKTWLKNCDSSVFLSYESLEKTLPFRNIYAPLRRYNSGCFWELIFGFSYVFGNISSRFDWYSSIQMDSFVFVNHLKSRLGRFDHQKPVIIIGQAKRESTGLTIMSHAAVDLLSRKLFKNEKLCPFNSENPDGLKKCFSNIGVDVSDERRLKLYQLEYNNVKWSDRLENELTTSDLLAITEIDTHMMYLIELISGDRQHAFHFNTTKCRCKQAP